LDDQSMSCQVSTCFSLPFGMLDVFAVLAGASDADAPRVKVARPSQ
jgi:hypothetical protein